MNAPLQPFSVFSVGPLSGAAAPYAPLYVLNDADEPVPLQVLNEFDEYAPLWVKS